MPKSEEIPPHEQYVLDVLLNCATGSASSLPKDKASVTTSTPGGIRPCKSGEKSEALVVPVLLSTIDAISHLRIYLPKDLRQPQARETTWKSVVEVQKRFPDGIPLLDPVENMKIDDAKFMELIKVNK